MLLAVLTMAAVGVVLPNTKLPVDQYGNPLLTGEADVLSHNGDYYFYFNNWGGCAGINCCNSSGGCASCCFKGPDDPCVYTNNHTVGVYKTNLATWEYLGTALSVTARVDGIEFRPHVVFNKKDNRFVMWYEDRTSDCDCYAVAVSDAPQGPFTTIVNNVKMTTKDRIGDFDIFVDDDDTAYHVRTGFAVEKLNPNYTGVTGDYHQFKTPKPSEGPVFFKRNSTYYIMPGTDCCACAGGSAVYVLSSNSPMGPYSFLGDIGSRQPFDKNSPHNYVTNAQASAVFEVSTDSGTEYVWVGNQWVTCMLPGNPRNHDLLYFTKLPFTSNGSISQLEWKDEEIINLASN